MAFFPRRVLPFWLLLALFSSGFAQRCLGELEAGFPPEALAQQATGRDAARILERAVNLLEPVLPPMIRATDLPVEVGDPDYDTFEFLGDRRLLVPMWEADTFSQASWQIVLKRLSSWYELPEPVFEEVTPTNAELIASLLPIIEGAARTLEPVALFAFDPQNSSNLAFWATIRNHGIYPRMIVMRPPEGPLDLRADVGGALELLSDCAVTLENYVYAPADTAERLFLATNEARMLAVSTPPPAEEIIEVPPGEETSYLTFKAPEVADKGRYTALFYGPSVGVPTLLRLLPQLRTNMNPREIIAFLGG